MARNMSGFVNKFKLHMQPIITTMSTVVSEKRDASVSQAQNLISLLQSIKVDGNEPYLKAIQEALKESFPQLGSQIMSWSIEPEENGGDEGGF